MRVRSLAIGLTVASLLLGAGEVRAADIDITDLDPHFFATRPTCSGGGVDYVNCTVLAFLDEVSLSSSTDPADHGASEFEKSFDAWAATADGMGWTLASGAGLIDLALNVTIFDAYAFATTGGLEIQIEWTYGEAGAGDKADFFWAQGLFDNYLLDGSIVPPFYEMDVVSNAECATDPNRFCPPLYPFQYVNRMFYDFPKAPWPNSFFHAEAFIAQADYANKVLTIYDGVRYGFDLSAQAVPEPATLLLVLSGMIGVGCRWRAGRES